MRNLLPLLGVTLLLGGTSAEARSISLPDEKPVVRFETPKGWTVEEIDRGVSLESPDKEVTLLLEITPASKLDSLVEENTDWLKKEQKVVFEGKTMCAAPEPWKYTSWKVTQADWGPGRVTFGVFPASSSQVLLTTCWITTTGEKKYGDAVQEIITSVQKTSASQATEKAESDATRPAPGTFGGGPSGEAKTETSETPKETPQRTNPPRQPSHPTNHEDDAKAEIDPSLLIGMWLGKKYISFYEDGRYGLQKWEGAPVDDKGRRWSLKGNQITWVTPDDKFTETIVSLTRQKLVIKDADGNLETYKRAGD